MPENKVTSSPDESSESSSWSGRLPWLLAALAATGAGAGAYRYLRQRRLSKNPLLRKIQLQSKGKFTRVLPYTGEERGAIGRALDRLFEAGGGKVLYEQDLEALRDQLGKKMRVSGAVLHRRRTGTDYLKGDVNLTSNKAARKIHEALRNDKWREYELINKVAPGVMGRSENIKDILARMGYDKIPIDPAEQAKMLKALQAELKARYPKGFLLKDTRSAETGGLFPTEKDDFNKLLQRWLKSGYHADKEKALKELASQGIDHFTSEYRKALKRKYIDTYSGRVLEKLLDNPELVMVQEKLPLEQGSLLGRLVGKFTGNPSTKEMRVHVVNGVVVPELVVPRFDPMMLITGRKHMRQAEAVANKIIKNLPKEYRRATFAMDITPVRNPRTGKIEYKVIETNPSGVSGMFYARNNPIAGFKLYRAFTGRHSRPVAAMGGALAGTLAGAGAYGVARTMMSPSAEEHKSQQMATPYHRLRAPQQAAALQHKPPAKAPQQAAALQHKSPVKSPQQETSPPLGSPPIG
jgi:hypothetical protein